MQEFKELDKRNNTLANEIAIAERNGDFTVAINLKKELYQNKLDMLSLISEEDKKATISARDYLSKFNALPVVPRFATGIKALDAKLNGGIQSGMFVQLAGESGVGKTHLFLEIISNISAGSTAVFFSFEMGIRLLAPRLQKLLKTEQQLDNFMINDTTRNIDDLIMEIEIFAKKGVKFFAIDSKMKIEVSGTDDEHIKISKLSNALSKLSQKRDIVILLINQMNEQDIKNKRLAMKGSGDQKYDADIALFYVRDEKGQRTLICNKNRQDEYEFSVDLNIDQDGRTFGFVGFEENNNSFEPERTEYVPDHIDMPDFGF